MTYGSPFAKLVGVRILTLAVLAFVLLIPTIGSRASAQTPSSLWSEWSTEVSINPQEANFNDAIGMDSALTVAYAVGDWVFESRTTLDEGGWVGQDFAVAGVLSAFSIASDLVIDPDVPSFTSWDVWTSVSIAGVHLDIDFTLADNDATLILGASGVAGDVGVGVAVTFGGDDNNICDLDWAGVVITTDYAFCCADVAMSLEFDTSGFDNVQLLIADVTIPQLPWLTIDAELVFDLVDGKTLELSPDFDFGPIVCFDLFLGAAYSGNLQIDGIQLDGIQISCVIGGVEFTGISYWGDPIVDADDDGTLDSYPGILTPYGTDYWEGYRISTSDDACCGPFGFGAAVFFDESSSSLFDLAAVEAGFSYEITEGARLSMNLSFNVDIGVTEIRAGFVAPWAGLLFDITEKELQAALEKYIMEAKPVSKELAPFLEDEEKPVELSNGKSRTAPDGQIYISRKDLRKVLRAIKKLRSDPKKKKKLEKAEEELRVMMIKLLLHEAGHSRAVEKKLLGTYPKGLKGPEEFTDDEKRRSQLERLEEMRNGVDLVRRLTELLARLNELILNKEPTTGSDGAGLDKESASLWFDRIKRMIDLQIYYLYDGAYIIKTDMKYQQAVLRLLKEEKALKKKLKGIFEDAKTSPQEKDYEVMKAILEFEGANKTDLDTRIEACGLEFEYSCDDKGKLDIKSSVASSFRKMPIPSKAQE